MTKSLERTLENLLIVALTLLTLLSISGVSFYESIRFAFVSGFVCTSGGQLWKIISKKNHLSTFEFIGMGLAFGSLFASFLQIVLRSTLLGPMAWTLIGVFIPIGMKIDSKQNFRSPKMPNLYLTRYPLALKFLDLLAITAFALASLWWWIYPFAIAVTISSISTRVYLRKKSKSSLQILISTLVLLAPMYVWCTNLRDRNDLWKIISHDQVFSESLSWSLNSFGRSDSPFLAGSPINYHWLSLHWAGLLTNASNGSSWNSIARVMPILSYIGIFSLLVVISSKLHKQSFNMVSIAIPFLFLSNTFGLNLEKFITSPTFQFTCIWMLATFNILISNLDDFSWLKLLFVGLMIFATLGGKLMNGLVVLGGLGIVLLIQAKSIQGINRRKLFFSLVIPLLATTFAYLYFYQSKGLSDSNTLKIGLRIGSDIGLVRPESTFLIQVFAALIFNLSMSLSTVLAFICIIKMRQENGFKVDLLAGSMIAGLVATTITSHGGGSQLYFLMASVVISLSLFPVIITEIKAITTTYWKFFLGSSAIGVVCQITWNYSNSLSDYRSSILIKFAAVSICPVLASLFWIYQRLKQSDRNVPGTGFVQYFCLVVLLSSVSIGIFQRLERLPQVSQSVSVNQADPTRITGSTSHLEILNWIRKNTPTADIIAINRFCIPEIDPCIMKWQLVSAISHRRVLIEGGYGNPLTLQKGELLDRFELSTTFAISPDSNKLKRLCDQGVTWFFYDPFGITRRIDWAPFASVQLSNDSASLLKLNCSSNPL
jgi:hypothetical protein